LSYSHRHDDYTTEMNMWGRPSLPQNMVRNFNSAGKLSQIFRCTGTRLRYPRPTPTYSNPMARNRTESSTFFVSTITGFFNSCLMRSKSSTRNSGQPVPTTSASIPSAAA